MASKAAKAMLADPTSTPINTLAERGPIQLDTPESLVGVQNALEPNNDDEEAEKPDEDFADGEDDEAYITFFRDNAALMTELLEIEGSSPESFWSRLEEYSVSLAALCDCASSPVNIVNRLIDSDEQDALRRLVGRVEDRWSEVAAKDLARYVDDFEVRLRAGASIREEHEFAKMGRRVLFAVGAVPAPEFTVDIDTWIMLCPTCMTTETQSIINRLHVLYDNYQRKIYLADDIDEKLKLWYLISSNLKKIFYELSEYGWRSKGLLYPLEKEFSNHPAVRKWYQYTTSMLDITCMQEIEEWVAEYCKYIHSRLTANNGDASAGLDDNTLSVLMQFGTSITENELPGLAPALHKAVARLNHLLGEPKTLRRLGRPITFFLSDEKLKTEMRLDPDHAPLMPIRPLKPKWWPTSENLFSIEVNDESELYETIDEEDITSESESDDASEISNSVLNKSHIPRGRNILSAYDYVYCNVPETRAYEVANSRLISRDLRDPGIVSRGLRVEDVVNLPPIHCRTPGTWTTWKQRIPLGPYEIFSLLGSTLLQKIRGTKPRSQPRPLQPPSITTRDDCRHYKHKNKLAAKQDPRSRVTKPQKSQRIGLRGGAGGPRYVHDPNTTPTRPLSAGNGVIFIGRSPGGTSSYALEDSPQSNEENHPPHPTGAGNNGRAPLGDITSAVVPGGGGGRFDDEDEQTDSSESLHISARGSPECAVKTTPPTGTIERCHPCPWYEGQYHHRCEGDCFGVQVEEYTASSTDEDAFFDGSLWEQREPGQWYPREKEVRSYRGFVAATRWLYSGSVMQSFALSNGAMIRICRSEGGTLKYYFYQAPRQAWATSRYNWGQLSPEDFLEEMPANIRVVKVLRPGRNAFRDTEYRDYTEIRELISPQWETNTLFRFHFDWDEDPLTVRLERARVGRPRERLVIVRPILRLRPNPDQEVPVWQSPQPTHIRDYNVRDFAEGDQAALNTQPGYNEIMKFQEQLRKNKEEQKKRDEEAQKQQAQQNAGAPENAGASTAAPGAAGPNANAEPNAQDQPAAYTQDPRVAETLDMLEAIRQPPAPARVVGNVPNIRPAAVPAPTGQQNDDANDKVYKDKKPAGRPPGKAVKKEGKTPEKPEKRITRAVQKALGEEAKKKADKATKEKPKKDNGKGKNKRPADEDSEDADDEGGGAALPPPKKKAAGAKPAKPPVRKGPAKKK